MGDVASERRTSLVFPSGDAHRSLEREAQELAEAIGEISCQGVESAEGCSVVIKLNDIALIVVFVAVLALAVVAFFFPDLLSRFLSH
jgi:hypothetical protein